MLALVALLAVAVIGVIGYQAVQDGPTAPSSCARTSSGNVQDAVDEIKGLIEDNTR